MIRNVGSNWILNVVRVLVLLHLTPFVIQTLGSNVYGAWIAIVAMTGLLKQGILGIPMASVRFMTPDVARGDYASANRTYSTCLGTASLLAVGAFLIGVVVYFTGFEAMLASEKWQGLPGAVRDNAHVAYWIVLVQVAVGFALRLPYAVFEAHQHFVVRNSILAGELALRWGGTMLALSLDASLSTLAAVQIALTVAEFVACRIVQHKLYPELKFGVAHFDRGRIREIMNFSVFTSLLNAGTVLAFQCDALVIGGHLGSTPITHYDIGNKFFEPLAEVVFAVAAVVMPTTIAMRAKGEELGLEKVFLRWSKIALSMVLWVGIYLWMIGPAFLSWWVGDEYDPISGEVLRILIPSFFIFLTARGVAVPVLLGLGHPAQAAIGVLVMGLLNLAISLLLVGPYGLIGVALGTAIPNVLFGVYAIGLATKQIDVPVGRYVAYVFGRAIPALIVPAAFLRGWQLTIGTEGLPRLIACGVCMSLVFGITWLGFVFRHDRFGDPLDKLLASRRRRAKGDE